MGCGASRAVHPDPAVLMAEAVAAEKAAAEKAATEMAAAEKAAAEKAAGEAGAAVLMAEAAAAYKLGLLLLCQLAAGWNLLHPAADATCSKDTVD